MVVKKLSVEVINTELSDKPVRLALRGGKLSLVATLPSKSGGGRKQQRIALGLGSSQLELEEARAKAYELFTQIVRDTFTWDFWNKRVGGDDELTKDTIERFYQSLRSRGMKEERIYAYSLTLKKLPQDTPLAASEIIKLALIYPPNSAARRQGCSFLEGLATFAGVQVDLSPYKGNYSSAKVKARDLPSDEEIEEIWASIASLNNRPKEAATVRWMFGMMATYGLRDHEVVFCTVDPEPPHVCRVARGKTGDREVYPLHPEWVQKFDLLNEKRPTFQTEGRSNQRLGDSVSRKMRMTLVKLDKYHRPYEMRHAYALRGELSYGFGTRVMAAMLGHSKLTPG
jgi:integrase